ncbi:MAG: DUF5829 family protein [Acidobacteria bacterium]|nr:DUF5829 family protein [Acidobacteriota bacterium]
MKRRSFLATAAILGAQPRPARTLLNHFYATVDSQTYAAIEANAFLKERFAPFEKRTTVRNDSTYSGLYFYGDQTYFEFFEANTGDRKPGDAGVALGLEESDGSERLRVEWQKLRPSITNMVTRKLGEEVIDWFQMTSFEETRANSAVEGLRLFSMQYAKDFVRRWDPSSPNTIRQRDVLHAYCAKLKLIPMRERSLLQDVQRIEIASPEAGIRVRAGQLEAAGWKLTPARDSILATGTNAEILFRFAPTIVGVTSIEYSLKRSSPPAKHQIGSTTLEILPGKRALWRIKA